MTRIDRHLDKMFYAFPSSPEARAMKENLRRDALEKLEELQNEGLSPQQAQQRVLEELGDGSGAWKSCCPEPTPPKDGFWSSAPESS